MSALREAIQRLSLFWYRYFDELRDLLGFTARRRRGRHQVWLPPIGFGPSKDLPSNSFRARKEIR